MKKLISLLLTLTLVLGMQAFAYTGSEANALVASFEAENTDLTEITQKAKIIGSNITYNWKNTYKNIFDDNCATHWMGWGNNDKSPVINAVLINPVPLDTVFVNFNWEYGKNADGTTTNSAHGTFGVAVYVTYVDGTVERLTYTNNTITDTATDGNANARFLELSDKNKAVNMVSVARVPRNVLDTISGFYDAYTGEMTLIKQGFSISELKLYTNNSKGGANLFTGATITKGGTAVTCLSDGYTAGVANILAGNVVNPLSAYSADMPRLQLTAANEFGATSNKTDGAAAVSGDSTVTLFSGESVVIDLGKYKTFKDISIAADNVNGLKIKGGKSNVPVNEMEEISTMSALTLTDGLYTSTNSKEDKFRYIALENTGSADITISEVISTESDPAPTITKRLGIGAWANGTWNWSNANNVLIPGTSYMYRNYINFAELNGKTYTMIVVLYDKDGRMIDIASGELTAEGNAQQEFVVQTGNGNARLETTKIKAILIDNLSDGTIYNIEEYTVQAAQ